jgi:hypothetical protein
LNLWAGQLLNQSFPELFSFAKNKNISIQKARLLFDINNVLHLPISIEAYDQLLLLAQHLENLPESDENSICTCSPWFSASKAYKQLIGHRLVHPTFTWLWKSNLLGSTIAR